MCRDNETEIPTDGELWLAVKAMKLERKFYLS